MIGSINSSSMIQSLFTKLDTSNKGYLEKSDLTSAFNGISSSSDSTSGIDDLFNSLDDDSDGKVSSDEFSSNVSTLLQSLNAQMAGGMKGMPPPPPPGGGDSGFSKEELQAQLEEIGDSDSQASSLISSILENFDSADSDSDGKVSFEEAMAYGEANGLSAGNNAAGASAMGGMPPPPPPPPDDGGFSAEELQAQLEEIGNSDSQVSSLISSILENFDSVDSDSDGKVSFQETMAYGQSSESASSASTSSSSTASSEQELTRMLLQLMQAYGGNDNTVSSRFSALA